MCKTDVYFFDIIFAIRFPAFVQAASALLVASQKLSPTASKLEDYETSKPHKTDRFSYGNGLYI